MSRRPVSAYAIDDGNIFELCIIECEPRWRFKLEGENQISPQKLLSLLQTTTDSIDLGVLSEAHCLLDSIDKSYTRDLQHAGLNPRF